MTRRSLPRWVRLVTPALLFAPAAPLGAQDTSTVGRPAVLTAERYSEPPAELVRLVTAPRHQLVALSNLSPDRTRFLALRSAGMPTVNEMGHRWHNLAGFQVDPQARRARSITTRPNAGLDIVDARTGRVTPVQLPSGMTVASPAWSPDGSQVAFLANTADGSWLYVAGAATGRSRRLSATPVLATAVTQPEWSGDGRAVLAVMVRDNMGAEPREAAIATGPLVRLTAPGKKNATRTYADLLEDPYDQQLLEHYATGQLTWIPVAGGSARKVGAPAMIQSVSASPDGRQLLVTLLQKPFSYTVQVGSFGTEQQVWDLTGKVLATVTKRPLREGDGGDDDPAARAAQDTAKRSVGWLPDGSGVYWLQQDPAPKGDTAAAPAAEGERATPSRRRDHLVQWSAPFDDASRKDLLTSANRIADVLFSPDAKTVFVAENANGTAHVYAVDLADPAKRYTISRVRGLQAQVGTVRQGGFVVGGFGRGGTGADSLTFYQDPGVVASHVGPAGEVATLSADGQFAFLSGTQYSRAWADSAPRPFVDRIEIRTGQKVRVWQSAPDRFEQPTLAADDRIVIQRESATEPPNWVSRSASGQEIALTRNTDVTPEITSAPKRMVQVTRPDGYKFWVTVTLPRGWQPGTRLPAIFWFYPYEFTDQSGYDRTKRNFNRNAFPRFGPRSMQYLVTQGYAVVEPDAPIVGAQGRMNDNYVSDLRNNLSATIDELDRQGIIDRRRLGLGGHSYGAFSTVNAMVHTPFFRAGIAGDGNYNRTLTPTAFQSERRDLWQARETYLSMSPLLYADRLTGALLMYHGLDDQNVGTNPINSVRLFHALLAQGKPAALYMYPYEDHGPVSRETLLDMWARWTAWLDYYVKNAR
ncbi:MAG: prolyl oligopeptidase family serine peptidase [Gemmatimonadaceae bacterium]